MFGARLSAAVCLAYYAAFWLMLDDAYWAGTSAAVAMQPTLGASQRKSGFRLLGTGVGAVFAVALTACFPQDRVGFLSGLALWGGVCAFVNGLLANFAAYAAALAGYTAAIIAAGAMDNPDQVFVVAINRASAVIVGVASVELVVALTNRGGAVAKAAAELTEVAAAIRDRIVDELSADGGRGTALDALPTLLGRICALRAPIETVFGESLEIRSRKQILDASVAGLFGALSNWHGLRLHFTADRKSVV